MDVAYDHIQEETLSPEEASERAEQQAKEGGLNSEFQEAFKAVSASPWGARLGGFLGQVVKQGESIYSDAQKEYTNASSQLRSSLIEHTRGISIPSSSDAPSASSFSDPNFVLPEEENQTSSGEPITDKAEEIKITTTEEAQERPESLPADIVKEATSLVSRFRSEASKRLKDVQRAEDAADEALLKFGTNVRDFLREAVTVTAPEAAAAAGAQLQHLTGAGAGEGAKAPEVLFETNDAEGRRVFHSSRFDAQLHAIHSRADSFLKDPEGSEWESWQQEFDVEKSTERIAEDLDKYDELRRQMGRLVPEKVEYAAFWKRYYFLRKAVKEEEEKRREVLKGIPAESAEDIGWGDDDEEEDENDAVTPLGKAGNAAAQSTTTLNATPRASEQDKTLLTVTPRRSHDEDGKSTADSDASYDIISGATSRAPGSPKEDKKEAEKKEESDEEDWE